MKLQTRIKKILDSIFLSDPGKDAMELIKIHSELSGGGCNKIVSYIKRIRYTRLQRRYNCFIPLQATIGDDIVFPHGLSGIFISSGAIIGTSAVVFQQVTIGSNTVKDSKGRGTPVVGNNVYIGAGAKIIGGVHIGDNVRIGANAVVATDIPDNATVVLEHPRIIIHDEIRDNKFRALNNLKKKYEGEL